MMKTNTVAAVGQTAADWMKNEVVLMMAVADEWSDDVDFVDVIIIMHGTIDSIEKNHKHIAGQARQNVRGVHDANVEDWFGEREADVQMHSGSMMVQSNWLLMTVNAVRLACAWLHCLMPCCLLTMLMKPTCIALLDLVLEEFRMALVVLMTDL